MINDILIILIGVALGAIAEIIWYYIGFKKGHDIGFDQGIRYAAQENINVLRRKQIEDLTSEYNHLCNKELRGTITYTEEMRIKDLENILMENNRFKQGSSLQEDADGSLEDI